MLRGWLLIIHVLIRANHYSKVTFFLISETLQNRNVGNFGAKRALTGEDRLEWTGATW